MLPKFWRPPFAIKPEQKVFASLQVFLKNITVAVQQLEAATRAFATGHQTELVAAVDGVQKAEQTADEIRRSMEKALFEQRFFDREVKIELFERIDTVADDALMAATIMTFARPPRPPTAVAKNMTAMASHIFKATELLAKAIEQLYTDWSKVDSTVQALETEREDADKAYIALMRELFRSNLSDRALMLLRDIAYRMSRTAGAVEEAGDRARFLAVRYA